MNMDDHEHHRRLLAQQHLQELGRALGREAERQGLTEEKLIEEMEKDRRVVYLELYGRDDGGDAEDDPGCTVSE
jgi:hypothetical protein